MAKKKNERYIPLKNYFIMILFIIGAILLSWYSLKWYDVFEQNKLSKSYLTQNKIITNELTELNEIETVFSEIQDYYLYISFTGNKDVYNLEKKLAKIINKYELNDNFYILTINSSKDDNSFLEQLSKKLKIDNIEKTNIPIIIIYKANKQVEVIKSKNNILNLEQFTKSIKQLNV